MTQHMDRDSRLRDIAWLGTEGLSVLRSKTVVILGVGNIGGEAARHLAMLGIPLLLVDRGVVEPENLGTQGFTKMDIGLPKVEARRRALQRLNPQCLIETSHADIETMGFAALRQAHLWLCCLDSLWIRVRVNEMAVRLGKPWIDAAIDGAGRSLARVAIYDPRSDSACFVCGYGAEGYQELVQPVPASPCLSAMEMRSQSDAPPTQALSSMGAFAASVLVQCAVDTCLGRPNGKAGRELLLNLDEPQLRLLSRVRDPHCLVNHAAWPLTPGLATSSELNDGFALAESLLGGPVTLTLLHRSLVTELICDHCGCAEHPYRLLETLDAVRLRCSCGATRRVAPTGLLDRMTRVEAADFLERRLSDLGIPADDVLIAQRGGHARYLLVAESPEAISAPTKGERILSLEARHGSRL